MAPMEAQIVVVGSANVDLVVSVTMLPRAGQTVMATGYQEFYGGKGANQAIAAARLGQSVAIVGRVGGDAAGEAVRAALRDEGVDVSLLKTLPAESTGRALVLLDAQAENSIVVIGGANAALLVRHVDEAAESIRAATVVVAQLEVPLEAVRRAAEYARGMFVLNPAPAQPLDDGLLRLVDVLIVNESEFEAVAGFATTAEHQMTADRLIDSNLPDSMVVTLGSRGALVWHQGRLSTIPAPPVTVVDSTGAGDTFVGALADSLTRGDQFLEAVQWAVCAATLSTGALGATTGMPARDDVAALLRSLPLEDGPHEIGGRT